VINTRNRLNGLEKSSIESDIEIRAKLRFIVQTLLFIDIINESKAERILKSSIDKVLESLKFIDESEMMETLDIGEETTIAEMKH